jgi:outer membrane protein OmpA-like peptidoglycan-associated protein
MKYSKMAPAVLFGGQINAWVLWAVAPDGLASNLGELPVGEDKSGEASYTTQLNNIALMLTAEPVPFVRMPSDVVAFVSLPSQNKLARNSAFSFSGFRAATQRDVESVAGLKLEDKTPVVLLQARRAVELLDAYEADKASPASALEARTALGQANDANEKRVGSPKDVPELSRRTITLASEALRDVVRQMDAKALADAEAKRQAELAALGQKAQSAEQARAKTAAELSEVQRERQALEAETARLSAEREAIARERDALARRLSGALGKVAKTDQTARGLVVSLSDGVLFDTGKSELKESAKISLAKLAGILMMMGDSKVQVEGHTDSTGSLETNEKLSLERAESVKAFLADQGVDAARVTAAGFGPTRPIATDDTAENRAKNRRVEIVLAR